MTKVKRIVPKPEGLFERTLLQALSNVKDGSITVIKQDNAIIQVNISENFNWTLSLDPQQSRYTPLKSLL